MNLRLDWCSHTAASYAVTHWHYSKTMPASKLAKVGVWEDGQFVGAIIFGVGATPELCKPYGLTSYQVAELVRVALRAHVTPTSRLVAIAVRLVHHAQPGLKLLVSFADSSQGHHGGIYQAGGWVYTGASYGRYIVTHGKTEHPRSLGARYGVGGQSIPWLRRHVDPHARQIAAAAKYRYLFPLDAATRAQVAPLAQPYPKRVRSAENGTAAPTAGDGVIPIRTLQL